MDIFKIISGIKSFIKNCFISYLDNLLIQKYYRRMYLTIILIVNWVIKSIINSGKGLFNSGYIII